WSQPADLEHARGRRGDEPLTIASKWDSYEEARAYSLAIDRNGYLDFRLSADGSSRGPSVRSGTPVLFEAWSHVAATFDGSVMRIFVNGLLQGTAPAPVSIYPGDAPLSIGTTYYSQQFFVGEMDDIALYARALSAGEIQAHAAALNPGARPYQPSQTQDRP